MPIASAAALNERCSTTAAKIAQASKSGRRISETIRFRRFHLRADHAPYLGGKQSFGRYEHDRETQLRQPGPCQSRLAQRAPPFFLRRLLRPKPDEIGRASCRERVCHYV